MNQLILSAVFVIALAGCASNKDPMSPLALETKKTAEEKGKEDAAAKSDDETDSASSTRSICPVLNAIYAKDSKHEGNIRIGTKVQGTTLSYNLSHDPENFHLADGKAHSFQDDKGNKGTIKLSCDAASITLEAQQNGHSPESMKIFLVSAIQVKVEVTGETAAAQNGTYTKL